MKIETLTEIETIKLLDHLLTGFANEEKRTKVIRNYTMTLLMLDAGLRVGEVGQLLVSDLIYNSIPVTSIIIRAEISKTHRDRQIPLSQRLSQSLKNMFTYIWSKNSYSPYNYAFAMTKKYCQPSSRQIQRIIKRAAMQSIGRPIHPHMLRHTFATRLMRITNIRVVQELLGHKNLSSTQVYTHPNSDDLSEAIKHLC